MRSLLSVRIWGLFKMMDGQEAVHPSAVVAACGFWGLFSDAARSVAVFRPGTPDARVYQATEVWTYGPVRVCDVGGRGVKFYGYIVKFGGWKWRFAQKDVN